MVGSAILSHGKSFHGYLALIRLAFLESPRSYME